MKSYKIVSVLWEDASSFVGRPLPEDLTNLIIPSLTVGILYKQNKRYVIIVSHIERYHDRDQADFNTILRSNIVGIKEHGTILLEDI